MIGMNNLYKSLSIIDLYQYDGSYDKLYTNSEKIFNSYFSKTTSGPINVVDNAIQFDGTFGLISNCQNVINFNSDNNVYIEFDVLITDSTSSRSDGAQCIFDITNMHTNKKVDSFEISVLQKFATFTGYNMTDQPYVTHHVYYDFNINTNYNFKIIKFNSNIFIYVDNILKYKSRNFAETSGIGTLGPRNDSYLNSLLKLGQFNSTADTSNLKGSLSNFKMLSFYDKDMVINTGFELNSEFLIHHIPFDYIEILQKNNIRNYIINIGKTDNISIGRPLPNAANHFYNIGQLYWWYKPTNHIVSLNDNIIKNNDVFSIIFKLHTGPTLTTGTIFDTRTSNTAFNNMMMSIAPDTSTFILRYSNSATSTSWTYNHTFPTGILQPNTEYTIGFTRQYNTVSLFVNEIEIESFTIDFLGINWTATHTYFFNTVSGTVQIPHYVRDLRIYNSFVVAVGILDESKIFNIVDDYVNEMDLAPTQLEYYANPRRELQLKYDQVSIDDKRSEDSIYLYNDLNNESYEFLLLAEGQPNKKIYVYINDILLYEDIGSINLNVTNYIKKYSYSIEGSSVIKKMPESAMIKGRIEIILNTKMCEGTDLFARMHNSKTGEFIGDYNLSNNSVIIRNLDCNNHYDVTLIDRNKVLENIVRSKLKPSLEEEIELRHSRVKFRELSYYEACLKYTQLYVNSQLAINPNISLGAMDIKNSSRDIESVDIYKESDTELLKISDYSIKSPIRLSKSMDLFSNEIELYGKDINLIKVKDLLEIGSEILYIESIISANQDALKLSVKRAVIDTYPSKHYTDEEVILLNRLYYDQIPNSEESINYKVVSINKIGISNSIISTPVSSFINNHRLSRPYGPGNIRINGLYNNDSVPNGDVYISWSVRDNNYTANSVPAGFYDENNVTVPGLKFGIRVYDYDNRSVVYERNNITNNYFSYSEDIELDKIIIEIFSIMNEVESDSYSIELTVDRNNKNIVFTMEDDYDIPSGDDIQFEM